MLEEAYALGEMDAIDYAIKLATDAEKSDASPGRMAKIKKTLKDWKHSAMESGAVKHIGRNKKYYVPGAVAAGAGGGYYAGRKHNKR